jgi:hypothetical protein
MAKTSDIISVLPEEEFHIARIFNLIQSTFDIYLMMRVDRVRYLRKRGGKVGEACKIRNGKEDFGIGPWVI